MKETAYLFWNKKWVLSLTIGVLLGLSWPPLPFPFLVFPAFLLLFRLIDLCDSAREAAYRTYPGFVVWNLITTYWLMMASPAAGIAAILANAAVMTLPVMLMHLAQKKISFFWLAALFQTAFWVSYEYLHHHWDLAWPWLALGNAWANVPALVQYISATGYLGISFWIILTTALGYQAIKHAENRAGYSAIGIALVFPVLSLIQLQFVEMQSEKTVETVVLQPNFDSYEDYGGFSSARESMNMLLGLADSVRTDSTDLIVWPESGIHSTLFNRQNIHPPSDRLKKQLIDSAKAWNTTLLGGAVYLEYYDKGNAPALPRMSGTDPYLYYNAAIAFQPENGISVYRKHNLVPIVERIPFVHFLNAIDVFGWINWANIQNYGKGYEPDQFSINNTKTPALICYDSVFPGWVRKFVTNGAGFITIITNDGWWGNTSGHEQHFAYARLRALEFRRWIVRSANNGISGIIAPDGSIKVETEYWTRTAFRYRVPVLNEQTLYTRFGDWLPWMMLFISVTGIVFIVLSGSKNKESSKNR